MQTAIDAGATIINIPDTVGFSYPTEYEQIFKTLTKSIHSEQPIVFSAHCHDDLGMAVSNSLAAIEGGARRIEGTVNGIGERAGNAALEEVALALYVRRDHYGIESQIKLDETKKHQTSYHDTQEFEFQETKQSSVKMRLVMNRGYIKMVYSNIVKHMKL